MDNSHDTTTERRQVTVLFCDIVDSTGLSERCDIEDLREILLEFQVISSRCINNAGGIVVNYIGDGIRAEFGYPLASENEAESAVHAGLILVAEHSRTQRALDGDDPGAPSRPDRFAHGRGGDRQGGAEPCARRNGDRRRYAQHRKPVAGNRRAQFAGDQRRH